MMKKYTSILKSSELSRRDFLKRYFSILIYSSIGVTSGCGRESDALTEQHNTAVKLSLSALPGNMLLESNSSLLLENGGNLQLEGV